MAQKIHARIGKRNSPTRNGSSVWSLGITANSEIRLVSGLQRITIPKTGWYNWGVLNICVAPLVGKIENSRKACARRVGKTIVKSATKKIVLTFALLLITVLFLVYPPRRAASEQSSSPAESIQAPVRNDHAAALAKAIAIIETSGTLDCNKTGLSGEKGCYQFLPSTWAAYSTEILGTVVEQTPENATRVTEGKIEKWIAAGYSDREIFLIWNQGTAGPCRRGVNRLGVPYDSCAYAENGLATLAKVIPTL